MGSRIPSYTKKTTQAQVGIVGHRYHAWILWVSAWYPETSISRTWKDGFPKRKGLSSNYPPWNFTWISIEIAIFESRCTMFLLWFKPSLFAVYRGLYYPLIVGIIKRYRDTFLVPGLICYLSQALQEGVSPCYNYIQFTVLSGLEQHMPEKQPLLLISIKFIPKTSHGCLIKTVLFYVFQVKLWTDREAAGDWSFFSIWGTKDCSCTRLITNGGGRFIGGVWSYISHSKRWWFRSQQCIFVIL